MQDKDEEKTKKYNGREGERVIRENHLDFLYSLYSRGVEIGIDNVTLLKEKGYIKEKPVTTQAKTPVLSDNVNEILLGFSTDTQKKIDSKIDIIKGSIQQGKLDIITDEELEERRKLYGHIFEGREEDIVKKDWMPLSNVDHEQDFVDWINSMNNLGFINKTNYRKFNLYCQQAYTWLQEKISHADFFDDDDRREYEMQELDRCDQNTLYFLNKYGYYKEGDDETGKVKYTARPVHEVMCYMDDCGYSVGIAKARQIAATTTLMMIDVKDMIFKTNHFMKFITEDKDKAEEIFEDKLKFPFSQLPPWMTPNVLNERDNLFKLGNKPEKGKKEGVGSKILVVAPKKTAIAGGAPQKVKIDEAGNIPILGKMIDNARPTMMWFNPKTKKIEIKRRMWFWGTGGEMDKGGKSFETEFMSLMRKWQEGDYSAAIIPMFFDWTTRPGATQEDYDREKRVAYAVSGEEAAKSKITEFHQSWPTSLADVFRTSAKTLMDDEYLEKALQRIRDEKKKHGHNLHQSGYFEPIYDFTSPADENSDVPYKIIGAEFVPTEDIDKRATTTIFMHPEPGWENRYFQGTDPIMSDTGLSKMASSIWDKYHKTVPAIMNYRISDYRQVFLQTMLLGIYYDTADNKVGVKELLESNIGPSYTQYKEGKGYGKEMVLNYQLPYAFQNRTTTNEGVGIDNKGVRNSMIINRIHEMTSAYGDRIYLEIFFEQMKTFTCNISDKGKEMWGPMNKKYFNDDTLFSTVYAYICSELCFPELHPKNVNDKNAKTIIRYVQQYDKNHNLVRVPIRVKA